jgi:hypothetical protein
MEEHTKYVEGAGEHIAEGITWTYDIQSNRKMDVK